MLMPGDPALLVRVGAERDEHRPAGRPGGPTLHAVAGRPHARRRRVRIRWSVRDSAGDRSAIPASPASVDVGAAPPARARPGRRAGAGRTRCATAATRRRRRSRSRPHRVVEHAASHPSCARHRRSPAHVRIEGRRSVSPTGLDDRHLQPAHRAGLGHLQPDVAATDDTTRRSARLQRRRAARRRRPGSARRRPRPRRSPAPAGVPARAGGEDEVVEGPPTRDPRRGRGRRTSRRPGRSRPPRCAVARRCRSAELLGSARHELVHVRRPSPRSSRGCRRPSTRCSAPLDGDDLQLVRAAAPARLGRRGHPRRVATDHDQPSAHGGNASPIAGAARSVPVCVDFPGGGPPPG